MQEEVDEVQVKHQGAHDGKLSDGLFVELVFHVGQVFLLTYLGKQRKNRAVCWHRLQAYSLDRYIFLVSAVPKKSGGLMGLGFDITS